MKHIILDSVSFDWRLQQMITTLRASWYDRKQDKEFTSTYKVRHQLTPQHYVYTDENSSNRLYVSGAFQSGKLTREEFNMIERELWAKWREIEPHYKKVAEALIRNIGQMVKGSRSELARNIKQAITEYRNEND